MIVCGAVVGCVWFGGREAVLRAGPAVGWAESVLQAEVLVVDVLGGKATVEAGLHPGGRVVAGGRGGGEGVMGRVAVVIHLVAEPD